ncbi:hypothetical protein [Yersinia kristensenii]|uniref:hypothetical protein n=1 Tax=Yersinia kristensenii TaxID=28152 RepID=UPI001595E75F|nr:hypothetical protein [Yersinia kristensenii]
MKLKFNRLTVLSSTILSSLISLAISYQLSAISYQLSAISIIIISYFTYNGQFEHASQ